MAAERAVNHCSNHPWSQQTICDVARQMDLGEIRWIYHTNNSGEEPKHCCLQRKGQS